MVALFALKALRDLEESVPRRVVILSNPDEETGSMASHTLIEDEAKRTEFVLVPEPSASLSGEVITRRKGVGRFVMEIQGRAARAGRDPEKGISGIEELARQIIRLHDMTNPTLGTHVNVGVVEGGIAPNVISKRARAEIDLRESSFAQGERLGELILRLNPVLHGAQVRVHGGITRPPFERTPQVVDLVRRARELGQTLTPEVFEGQTGAGGDGNLSSALGPTDP